MDLRLISVTNVYVSKIQKMTISFCVCNVDNIFIIYSNDKIIKSTKNILNSKFDMKDMEYTNVILGVKIS